MTGRYFMCLWAILPFRNFVLLCNGGNIDAIDQHQTARTLLKQNQSSLGFFCYK